MFNGAPIQEKPRRKKQEVPPPPPAPPPGSEMGPITFSATGGPLPDDPNALLDVINNAQNVAHAVSAMEKLGQLYGRDVIDDNAFPGLKDFNPMIIAAGVGSDKQAIASFACYAVPLRRALAKYFQATTPDVGMMIDLAVVSYWKAVQAERASVTYLQAALEKPHFLDRLPKLEMIKELAVRQMTRLLESLRVATGKRIAIDPEDDIAKVLRFPKVANANQRLQRKASST